MFRQCTQACTTDFTDKQFLLWCKKKFSVSYSFLGQDMCAWEQTSRDGLFGPLVAASISERLPAPSLRSLRRCCGEARGPIC